MAGGQSPLRAVAGARTLLANAANAFADGAHGNERSSSRGGNIQTFLIYLNRVEAGGETAFPRLNITVSPTAYAALVFNNCLDNGEPDERSLHEGIEPAAGVKYAINGWVHVYCVFKYGPSTTCRATVVPFESRFGRWVRSKSLFGRGGF